LKIAIICSYDFSIAWSLEIFVKKLLLNHKVTVISDMHNGHTPGHYTNVMKQWSVEHKFVKTYRFFSPYEDLKYLLRIYKILKKENYDMVINIATKPNIYGSIAAKRAGIKNIICFGWGLGLTFEKSKNIGRITLRYILSALYWYAFKVSNIVWFTNKNDLDYFASKKIIDPNKAFVTKGFVDTKLYSPDSVSIKESFILKKQLGYKDEDKIIILVARMSWAKGIKQFCESSDFLREKYPDVKFLMVGQDDSGSPDSVPKSYIKKYVNFENFNYLGYRIDIKELYSISYLAVFPSYYREGGWPRGLTEPMSMGMPVITTDNKHCSGAVIDGYNGLIVPIKDSSALAEGIEKIVNDEGLAKEFGQRSREKALLDLNEELIMQDLVEAIL
jgi:N,N'-diacetylbacillosaminyl-diphospho-undecaprenol alpha-1,3-N-acetylgalactosaminyltransferase